MPAKVQNHLDKIRRDFLWEGNSKDHKFHLAKWAKITMPKQFGGLGIKDLALHNKCMLMKWHWRYNQETIGLWKEVIQEKFGSTRHWCSNEVTIPYGTGVWKAIRKLWEVFYSNATLKVGSGEHIQFWKDTWLGNIPLMNVFPRIFQIASNPDSTISQCWEGNTWNVTLRRNLNDWELEEFMALMASIQTSSVHSQSRDRLTWGSNKDG
ncbi:hypothetical protein MTR67_012500 [Solanum verrucosum]|uniref:Uncharacterized protein n=1 Tax=Solanum verrucosum TaxID=315347 RepID=A0AAF0QBF2_SOLVR|nr:hypothetical protein MTR67_012500 [Solanum verrucosum]